jgi:PPOX class probable F420-dependent enzyme
MSVRLTDDEAWERLAAAHTGIFTTLRADGRPVPLPVWFAVLDRRVYLRTPGGSAKVHRIRHDSRCALLVESGHRWVELAAVLVQGRAVLVEDETERAAAAEVIGAKYDGYGVPADRVPQATLDHYADDRALIRIDPEPPLVTWDNARLRLKGE